MGVVSFFVCILDGSVRKGTRRKLASTKPSEELVIIQSLIPAKGL